MKIVKIIFLSCLSLSVSTAALAAKKSHKSHRKAPHAVKMKRLSKAKKINLNKVDAITLSKSVKGIGPSRAKAIVAYRESHGGFKSVEDLTKVKGIGKSFLKKNKATLRKVLVIG